MDNSDANHAGFVIHPCDARQPQQKGKVERDVRYTRDNAFEGIQVLPSVKEGNRLLAAWNQRWARQRIHGTTRRQVWEHFQSEELPALKALTLVPYSMLRQGTRCVDVHGYIQVEGSFYSVPARLLRQRVVVRWDARKVRIIVDEVVVAEHGREHAKPKIVTQTGHLPEAMTGGDSSFVRYYLQRGQEVGQCCHALVERLLTGPNAGNPLGVKQARGIVLDLQRRHGTAILEQACKQAGAIRIPSWKTLGTICQNLSESSDDTPPDPSPESAPEKARLQQEDRAPGSEDAVKRWILKLRRKSPRFFQQLPILPGEKAQMDILEGPRVWDKQERTSKRRSWSMVLTLSPWAAVYSRIQCWDIAPTEVETVRKQGIKNYFIMDLTSKAVRQILSKVRI